MLVKVGQQLSRAINLALVPFASDFTSLPASSSTPLPASNSTSLPAENSIYLSDFASNSGIKFFLVFDEAHTLIDPHNSNESASHSAHGTLHRVLSFLKGRPLFTIFLSTNSKVQASAPSADRHPSLRAREGDILFPPFVELPFDLFANFTGSYTLREACSSSTALKFGRPMSVVLLLNF